MKPLIREFIYDKLRKSLYKHELKTKVWNNPYFPYSNEYNSDQAIQFFAHGELDEGELLETIESIKRHPSYNKATKESYAFFIKIQEEILEDDVYNRLALLYLNADLFWVMIEEKYGKPDL